jgi:hypothetical protein
MLTRTVGAEVTVRMKFSKIAARKLIILTDNMYLHKYLVSTDLVSQSFKDQLDRTFYLANRTAINASPFIGY